MSVSAAGGFAKSQQINQAVARITQSGKASQQQTTQTLNAVGAKQSQAATKVVDAAMDVKDIATRVKGNTIDVIA